MRSSVERRRMALTEKRVRFVGIVDGGRDYQVRRWGEQVGLPMMIGFTSSVVMECTESGLCPGLE